MSFSLAAMGMLALTASQLVTADPRTCMNNNTLSCHSYSKAPTCCYQYPGGALLQTQFWDTDPATGPSDSWTIHGLWPDNCDGSYESYCDSSRTYTNITTILRAQGRTDLLAYMDTYWVDMDGDNESFWEHEWNKHGTCLNTIEPRCYSSYNPQEEVGDYFQKTVDLFRSLDTYKALAAAGIVPDTSTTYTSSQVQSALSRVHGGVQVYLGCDNAALNEVWYFFNVRGNVIDGQYRAAAPLAESTCPSSGIQYLPKSG